MQCKPPKPKTPYLFPPYVCVYELPHSVHLNPETPPLHLAVFQCSNKHTLTITYYHNYYNKGGIGMPW